MGAWEPPPAGALPPHLVEGAPGSSLASPSQPHLRGPGGGELCLVQTPAGTRAWRVPAPGCRFPQPGTPPAAPTRLVLYTQARLELVVKNKSPEWEGAGGGERDSAERWGRGCHRHAFLLQAVTIKLRFLRTGTVTEEFCLFINNCNVSYHQIPKLAEGTPSAMPQHFVLYGLTRYRQ